MERVQFIMENDRVIDLFGMELEEAREGYVRISVVVKDEFLNAHNIAHGALIFALADVAFAIAVNSVTDAVGVQWSFNTFRAAMPGEKITAECDLIHRGKSLMVVDYRVTNESGKLIAKGQATALPVPRDRFKN
jgi:acyl-CoA thioesterase